MFAWVVCGGPQVRAEALYFGKDMEYIEKLSKTFDENFKALENASPTLDAVCFMRIRKNG